MRIIVKPLGLVVVMTTITCFAAMPRLFPLASTASVSRMPLAEASLGSSIDFTAHRVALVDNAWEAYADPGAQVTMHPLTVETPPLKQAYRLDLATPGASLWAVGFHNRIPEAIPATTKVQVIFWARATEKSDLTVAVQATTPPYTVDAQETVSLTPEWQRYTVDLTIGNHDAGEGYLTFALGKAAGSVELGDVRLTAAR